MTFFNNDICSNLIMPGYENSEQQQMYFLILKWNISQKCKCDFEHVANKQFADGSALTLLKWNHNSYKNHKNFQNIFSFYMRSTELQRKEATTKKGFDEFQWNVRLHDICPL